MSPATAKKLDLDKLVLKKGAHNSRRSGVCVMEAVAWFAGREHTDSPPCVSPVIAAFLRRWNDDLDDEGRQRLKALIPIVVSTATTQEDENLRGWMVTDWMVREHTPAWLELAGLREQAASLRSLPPLLSSAAASSAQPTIDAARSGAAAAWAAAGDAAWAAAWAAAGDAAWAAAGAAAWDAAWAAARDAAWAAAKQKLAPTVTSLQQSALELLDRLIAMGEVAS